MWETYILFTSELWFECLCLIHSFYIDEVPIREVVRSEAMGGDYPSKPMSLYTTIWDGSSWATSGGRYKVDYKYAPFVSEFKDLVIQGCAVDPIQQIPTSSSNCHQPSTAEDEDYAVVTPERRLAMRKFRQKYMTYSYCYDVLRYPVPQPECVLIPSEQRRFKETGHLKFGGHHRHRKSKRPASRVPSSSDGQSAMWWWWYINAELETYGLWTSGWFAFIFSFVLLVECCYYQMEVDWIILFGLFVCSWVHCRVIYVFEQWFWNFGMGEIEPLSNSKHIGYRTCSGFL